MSRKRLFALVVWSATLAATGAIADVAQPLDSESRDAATQSDTEEMYARAISHHQGRPQSGDRDRGAFA